MAVPLRVLVLEDDPTDAQLILRELSRAGLEHQWHRVETQADYLRQLENPYDLILADYILPQFDGMQALRLLKARGLDIPFIILSGAIGEELAVAAIREGATDYLSKDRLTRLGPAVVRALELKSMRDGKRQAEELLRKSQSILYEAERIAGLGNWDWNISTNELQLSDGILHILGYLPQQTQQTAYRYETFLELIHAEDRELVRQAVSAALAKQKPYRIDHRMVCRDGTVVQVHSQGEVTFDRTGTPIHMIGTLLDITERKRAEESLRAAHTYTRNIIDSSLDMIIAADENRQIIEFNRAAQTTFGYSYEEILGQDVSILYAEPPERQQINLALVERGHTTREVWNRRKNGEIFPCLLSASVLHNAQGVTIGYMGVSRDITDQKRAEADLKRYAERLAMLHQIDLAILNAISVQEIASAALEHLGRLLPFTRGSVALFDWPANQGKVIATAHITLDSETGRDRFALDHPNAWSILKQGQTMVVEDRADSLEVSTLVEHLLPEQIHACILVPLMSANHLTGTLNLGLDQHTRFSAEDRTIVGEVATVLAVAVERARLHDETVKDLKVLRSVSRAAQPLQFLHTQASLQQEITQLLKHDLGYANSTMWLVEPPDHRIVSLVLDPADPRNGFSENRSAPSRSPNPPISQEIITQVARTGKSVLVRDVHKEPGDGALPADIRSVLSVPLRIDSETVGVLNVTSPLPYAYSEIDQTILETVASQIGVAIQNTRLFDQVLDGRERLKNLSNQLLKIQEEERRYLARELHDELGQALTVVNLNIQSALRRTKDETVKESLSEALHTIANTLQQVRDLSLDLHPAMLDDMGLVAAVDWYAKRQATRAGWSIEFVADPVDLVIPDEIAVTYFRVTQEALTNVVRHANAKHVWIELHSLDPLARDSADCPQLELIIRDDGVGFDPAIAQSRSARSASLGLVGMRERVELVGGSLEIVTTPSQGTRIRALCPLEPPSYDAPRIERRKVHREKL